MSLFRACSSWRSAKGAEIAAVRAKTAWAPPPAGNWVGTGQGRPFRLPHPPHPTLSLSGRGEGRVRGGLRRSKSRSRLERQNTHHDGGGNDVAAHGGPLFPEGKMVVPGSASTSSF